MKTKLTTVEKWWNDSAEYEATHEIAFASPRALKPQTEDEINE